MSLGTAFLFAMGMSTGNFLYQFFGGQDWAAAVERSFFTTAGILAFWAFIKINGWQA
jgi:hypothetical protein